jgi:methyltransferase
MKWMSLLHGAWLVAMPLEVALLGRTAGAPLAAAALSLFVGGQLLRYAALSSLGRRWCVRVITVPGERVQTSGIYRYLRHPNHLGVCLEIAALPLVHGAWLTAAIASALNAALLRSRILAEERALSTDQDYAHAFEPRLSH